jgi:hypothetical protein
MPGGDYNPVAIIRVPRERMIGSGIASSLIHEVGHQAAALLDLMPSLQAEIKGLPHVSGDTEVWALFERWLSEILADFWSVARIGLVSTLGLIGVVSLPRAFVFRLNLDDPHPMPWLRVKISCAIGQALYPHPQWARTARVWEAFYPLDNLDDTRRDLISRVEATLPEFIGLLVDHRPASLRGRTLREVLDLDNRQPAQLLARFETWRTAPKWMYRAPPTLVFAVLGQAKADGRLSPEDESELLVRLLTHWAMRSTLNTSAFCVVAPKAQTSATLN